MPVVFAVLKDVQRRGELTDVTIALVVELEVLLLHYAIWMKWRDPKVFTVPNGDLADSLAFETEPLLIKPIVNFDKKYSRRLQGKASTRNYVADKFQEFR